MTAGGRATLWRIFVAAVLLFLLWHLRTAALLLFAAVLMAATLQALADPLVRHTPLPARPAVIVVVLALLSAVTAAVWLLGSPLAEQLQALREGLPQAWESLRTWLQQRPLGLRVLALLDDARTAPLPWANLAMMAADTFAALTNAVLILLIGLYLAFDVDLYRNGFVRLFEPRHRSRISGSLDAAGHAQKRWLLGQAVTMAVVGGSVAIVLTLLGMPMALALGAIAGVLEFVPFLGPIVSGALAVLVAFVQGPQQALYVALAFLAIQQLEGNLIVPLVQRWAVQLPPALVVAAVLLFGTLFGLGGVLLATPLVVVTMVLLRKLHVEPMEPDAH